MLDDDERTVLEETERALARNDPRLVRRMQRGWRGGGRGRQVAVALATLALVVGLLWLDLPGQALLVILVGLGFLLAFGWRPPGRLARLLRGDDDEPRR